MKKDKPLDRVLFDVTDFYLKERWSIFPEDLEPYIPDLPARFGLYLYLSWCEAHPFVPDTAVYPAFAFYTADRHVEGAPSDPLIYDDFNYDFIRNLYPDVCYDIRDPQKFNQINWLRACLLRSTRAVKTLAEMALYTAAGRFKTEVEAKLFLTYFHDWRESWVKRRCPIYLGAGVTNMLDKKGYPRDYKRKYPLDPNLSSH